MSNNVNLLSLEDNLNQLDEVQSLLYYFHKGIVYDQSEFNIEKADLALYHINSILIENINELRMKLSELLRSGGNNQNV